MKRSAAFLMVAVVCGASAVSAATLQVGAGKTYAAPCAAIAAASDGDVIEIDAATYAGDVCAVNKNGLTLRGVGGLAKLDAAGKNYGGKAIWVISGNDTVVENIEFFGATVPDQNGAGIRQEGANLTVRHCYFHNNEDGILAGNSANSTITIEYTEFANNGFGDGQSHNLYINHVGKLVFQYNYSHHAKIGHLLKSRAAENWILYNRLTGEDGTDSYEIDLPNGGRTFIIGNLVQQGPNTDNSSLVAYRREGADPANPSNELFIVNNTFVNDRPNGATFFNIDPGVTEPVLVRNNILVGVVDPKTLITQGNAVLASNFQGDPMFVNQGTFDYHLKAGSPCADAGEAPGMGAGIDLTPKVHYVHPAASAGRMTVGKIDIGAYELNGEGGVGGTGGMGVGGGTASGGTGGMGNGAGGDGGTGGTNTGGSAGSGGGGTGSDGSCSCEVVGAQDVSSRLVASGLVLLAFVSRRRRMRARA